MLEKTVRRVIDRLPQSVIDRTGEALLATVRPDVLPPGGPLALPQILIQSGDLELRAVLGQGGMGRVVLAHQRSLGRDVAVKSLLPNCQRAEAEAALLMEGRCAGGLEHPNIVPIYALGRDEHGGPVLVMKRVEGTSWRNRLFVERIERNLEILIQVCNAAHFAHTRGVLHRDFRN